VENENRVKMMEDECNMDVDDTKMEEVGNNKIQHPLKRAFLAAVAETGNITSAAKLSGLDRTNHYRWIQEDSTYAMAYKDALEQAAENLEREARRRAIYGVSKPVFYKGEECGTVQEYSDTLLIFLLKGAIPEKYKERFDGNITGSIDINVLSPSDRQARLIELLRPKQLESAIDADYTVIDEPDAVSPKTIDIQDTENAGS